MIDGVKVKDLKPIPDDRGMLMEMWRSDDPDFQGFGQVYITWVYPGVVKAWHYHKKQTDHFVCVSGMAKVALHDAREGSPTRGETNDFVIGWQRQRLLIIPPGVYHGFTAVGTEPAGIINIPTELYDHDDPDEFRLPFDDPSIPLRLGGEEPMKAPGLRRRRASSAVPSSGGCSPTHPDRVEIVNLDKLTYAGNLDNLRERGRGRSPLPLRPRRHLRPRGGDRSALRASTPSSTSPPRPTSTVPSPSRRPSSIPTSWARTPCWKSCASWASAAWCRCPPTRSTAPSTRARSPRRTPSPFEPLLGLQGRRRPAGARLPAHVRPAGDDHPGLEHLRSLPVSREADPALRHQRARGREAAPLRRRTQRARLAARR